ncbi:tetratricopeptide repeat protein [Persicitalea jodogahamensis]|uniref:Uncharacterized protein n=1 Tax=Persicitalea jodogahamensis TaxID=402147 RepID=A0A8J3GAB0_9BACT|nr:hypothetical protein [Persicitalea jodogahamensis]GHB79646.1 hypothetical protein GCM10007390_37180 [Persicitalea jodogahamensis]
MHNLYFYLLFFLAGTASPLFAQTDSVGSLSAEKRESYIQNATHYRMEENYGQAIQQLDSILSVNPVDGQILLFRGDLMLQSRRFSEAVSTYQKLLPLKYEPTVSQINLSYALFMNHKPAKALTVARSAWKGNPENSSAVVNYFNAMLWNRDTRKAATFLNEQKSLLSPDQLLVLKARLHTTSGDYTQGLMYYDSLVDQHANKYYFQEYAEVLLGKKENEEAVAIMEKGDTLFSENDKNSFLAKVRATQLQQAGTEFVYFKDIGQNIRIENSLWWLQSADRTYQWGARAGISEITSGSEQKTSAYFGQVTLNTRWSKAWTGQGELRFQSITPKGQPSFVGITGRALLQYQPNDRRMVGFTYSSDILNYTASLLGKNVHSNNFGYTTHLMLNGNNGFFSQGSFGMLNDQNQRLQFFGSLYHLFRTEPTLKGGLNFSALHFRDNSIETYFAPNQYLSTEIFADFTTSLPHLAKWYFQMQAAGGMQKIETAEWNPAYRVQGELSYRTLHFETSIKYQNSNVAASTGAGYKFDWLTLKLVWKW